jgi:N-acetylneuraminic acid mutarotase
MDTDEEPPGLPLSQKTETGCINGDTLYIVVGIGYKLTQVHDLKNNSV